MCAGLLLHERLLAPSRGSRVRSHHYRAYRCAKRDTNNCTYGNADGGTYGCPYGCTYCCAFGCAHACTYGCADPRTDC